MRASALLALAVPALLLAAPTATAQDAPAGYTCSFKRGTSQAYGKSRFRRRQAQPLSFSIDAIDLPAQKADLVTATGRGPLRIVLAIGANHFLEVVAEGYLNVTTVYAKDARSGLYPAVHSRHFGLFGEPLVAQYTGTCTAKPKT